MRTTSDSSHETIDAGAQSSAAPMNRKEEDEGQRRRDTRQKDTVLPSWFVLSDSRFTNRQIAELQSRSACTPFVGLSTPDCSKLLSVFAFTRNPHVRRRYRADFKDVGRCLHDTCGSGIEQRNERICLVFHNLQQSPTRRRHCFYA
nr:hypothetical protein CFP56_25912 [Quercus suber]